MSFARFITLEGIEGVGKSTNISFIADYLRQRGEEVLVTREPGGTYLGEQVRNILLSSEHANMSPVTELLLMFASRVQHIEQVIKPALQTGKWVVSDRYVDASFAYQGGGRGVELRLIECLESNFLQDIKPQLTFLLDVPVSLSQDRLKQRETADRFERESGTFFTHVRQAYLQRVKNDPKRFCVVDATQALAHVQANISAALESLLKK